MGGEDVIRMLDEAVTKAKAAGMEVSGWTMQSSEDGYVAWLYVEDEEGQNFLFDEVDVHGTAQEAAASCLALVTGEQED